ncbi:elongin-A [Spea bombifrons]|uniref:elongin-A n=1 Tax=Spea bombifrons TaxID=233779 RepID=UPI00234B4C25|nr:elongin-A [Spea bombifrons]
MAESVLEVVKKLQSRLSASTDPKKLHKTLKRLADLPVTVDTLVETGVGKTVNGLRKHEVVGDLAKTLVAQWKKLVPQEVPRVVEPVEREPSKQPRPPSPRDEEDLPSQTEYRHEDYNWQRYSEQEDSDDRRSYSSEPTHSPQNIYIDRTSHKSSKEQKSSHKDKHKQEDRSVNTEKKKEKYSAKEHHRNHSSFAGSSQGKWSPENRPGKKEKSKHKIDTDNLQDAKKQKFMEKPKSEKQKVCMDEYPVEKIKKIADVDKEPSIRHKVDKTKVKSRTSEPVLQEKKSIKISMPSTDQETEDVFEQPKMSFESYLSYEEPQKKKRKPVAKTPNKSSKQSERGAQVTSKDPAKQHSKPATDTVKESHKKMYFPATLNKVDEVPVLPDIPLPLIQPNYRPLPTFDPVVSPNKRKVPPSFMQDEEEGAGFTGRRFNSKMQVYSGSKTAYLPKMMSLYEQCIRVLSNNIDSIYEVGGVPYSVLEPVLEKCTPEQLYRIEEHNHVLVEDTDRLWMNHCKRDFKKEKPEEFETWREMFLRLHEAREQRLLKLTQNIRSAHANKPKGRQAMMAFVNSTVKPPRDVRRRQEKFGTGTAVVAEKSKIKPFVPVSHSSTSNHVHSEEHRSYEGPSTSSSSSTSSSVQIGHDPRKPQVKKVAPMMAKTIKAFKNRFSRR